MSIFRFIFDTFLEALFPLQESELSVSRMSPNEAFAALPRAPACPIPGMRAIFAYKDERVSKLVWHVKYKKSEHAVHLAGYALFQVLQHGLQTLQSAKAAQNPNLVQNLVILPMPVTERRRKERGYNQCELLTAEIGRLTQLEITTDLLIRTHHSSRQTLKDRKHRLESAKGIFSVNEIALNERLKSNPEFFAAKVVVIDDVITTGSTMKEAIETLQKAGFTNVSGLAVAH